MVIYHYKCPKCGYKTRDIQIVSERHSKCPESGGKDGPYMSLDKIWIEGIDAPEGAETGSNSR